MNDVLQRVTGKDAISLPATIALGVALLISNLISSGIDTTENLGHVAGAWALSMAVAFGFLWAVKPLLHKLQEKRDIVWQTLGAFVITYILRAIVFDQVVWRTGASETSELAYRLAATLATFGFGLLLCAYIVSMAREFSRNVRQLSLLSTEREDLTISSRERVAEHRLHLIETIQSTLRREVLSLVNAAPQVALNRVRDTIEQVVRPISRHLVTRLPDLSLPEQPQVRKIAWISILRNVVSDNPIRPLWFAVWAAGSAWSISILRLSVLPASAYVLVVFCSSFIVTLIFRAGWHWVSKFSRIVRSLYVSVAALIVGILVYCCSISLPVFTGNQRTPVVAYVVISLGIFWFIAVTASLRREVLKTAVELHVAEDQLRDALVTMNVQMREQRLALSRALHGPVQDCLTIAAFKLANALSRNEATPQLVSEVVESIEDEIIGTGFAEISAIDVDRALTDLASLWEGVVQIRTSIDEEVSTTLTRYPATTHTVMEVVREACSNAIRHGEASNVTIDIALGAKPMTIEVNVKNDGHPVSPTSETGVGSFLLNELTLEWSRESITTGTIVKAIVPLV